MAVGRDHMVSTSVQDYDNAPEVGYGIKDDTCRRLQTPQENGVQGLQRNCSRAITAVMKNKTRTRTKSRTRTLVEVGTDI